VRFVKFYSLAYALRSYGEGYMKPIQLKQLHNKLAFRAEVEPSYILLLEPTVI